MCQRLQYVIEQLRTETRSLRKCNTLELIMDKFNQKWSFWVRYAMGQQCAQCTYIRTYVF